MVSFDVNVLVNAYREAAPDHALFKAEWEKHYQGSSPVAISSVALSGFVRIVTHPKIFFPATPLADALEFCEAVISHPLTRQVEPGKAHARIFFGLCREIQAGGNLVADAWFAALAIEQGLTWISGDRDYGLFPELNWKWVRRS